MKHIRTITAIAAAALLNAENLLFNGGFELGLEGFETLRTLRMDKNTALTFIDSVIDTKDTDGSGQSVVVQNPYAEPVELWGREFLLKANTAYTLSFSCKASSEEYPVEAAILSVDSQWINYGKSFTAGTAWKRMSHTFTTGSTDRYCSIFLRCSPKNDTPAEIRFDSIMVEAGTGTWQPTADIEIGIAPDRMVYVGLGTAASITLTAKNYSAQTWSGTIALERAEDHFEGSRAPVTNIALSLAPGEKSTVVIPHTLDRFGTFFFDARVDGKYMPASVMPGHFAVVGAYTPKPIDIESDFVVAVNGSLDLSRTGTPYVTCRAAGMDHRGYMKLLSLTGLRLLRVWDSGEAFDLSAIEPQRGRIDFTLADMTVAAAAEHGIRVLPVIGGTGFVCNKTKGWPSWVRDSAVKLKPPEWMKHADYIAVPEDDLWRHYVRTVANRYKGTITHYEICNEPNLYLPATNYVALLKGAYSEIKAADPSSRVLGFCTTGDLGGNVADFFRQAYALGGLSYADIVSFHPYDAPELGSISPADKQIETARALMKQHGHEKPLWNSELYYVKSTDSKHWFDKEHVPGEYAARRFLTDLGEGVKQSISLQRSALFQSATHPNLRHNFGLTRWQPSDIFVVMNALARHFEGAKPVTRIAWVPDSVCYIYEKSGTYSAAFWRFGAADGVSVKLAMTDADGEVFDMFGNRISLAAMPLALRTKPFYLVWKGTREKLVNVLSTAEVGTGIPIVFGTAHLVPAGNGWAIAAAFQNNFNKELPLRVGAQGAAAADDIAESLIPPGAAANVLIPVTLKNPEGGTVIVRAYANRAVFDFPIATGSPKKVIAAGREKGDAQPISVNSAKAAHTALFRASRDDSAITVSVKVTDTTPSGDGGTRNPWEQDCVELFFDADPAFASMKNAGAYHDRVGRIFILPYAKDKMMLQPKGLGRFTAAEISFTVDTRADGYVISVRVPYTSLGITPQAAGIGFDIAVDDAAGAAKAASQLLWNSSGDAYKNRTSFGYIRFE